MSLSRNQILIGDVRAMLRTLPEQSVHCVVTSPPYWGLRVYGTDPQVWGGEADCDHEWTDERTKAKTGGTSGWLRATMDRTRSEPRVFASGLRTKISETWPCLSC